MKSKISIGNTLKCMFCEKNFVLERIDFDSEAEYVTCPHCEKTADIQKYHFDMRGIDIKSIMRECVDFASRAKQKGNKCRDCLFWEFENGKRGDFCLKNGEIGNGAERLHDFDFFSPSYRITFSMNEEQKTGFRENKEKADNCVDFVGKEKCLKELRKEKRTNNVNA